MTALRKIFTVGLFEDVADPEKWRLKMKVYEHRYKEMLVGPTRRHLLEGDGGGNGLTRRDGPLHVWLGD